MTEVNPTETTAESTSPEVSAVEPIVQSNLDSDIDNLFAEWDIDTGVDAAAEVPAEDPEVDDEPIEVSTDKDEAPVDGDSDTDAGEEDKAAEESEEDTSDSVVDWDEMKQHSFEIDGKTYSANDLKAALGRQTKQEEARIEVETAQKALAEEREAFESQVKVQNTNTEVQRAEIQLAAFAGEINRVEAQVQEADKAGDAAKAGQLDRQARAMRNQYAEARQKLDEHISANSEQNDANQRKILEERGFGSLVTDSQRNEALASYIQDNYSPQTFALLNENAEYFILAEKARLYDKANAEVPKGKLKATKKTLRAGAAKTPKPKPQKDRISSAIDKLFGDD